MKNIHRINGEIYITSLKENVKDCYALCTESIWKNTISKVVEPITCGWQKIVVSSDKKLNVQHMDSSVLSFLAENPSCEFLELEELEVEDYVGFAGHTGYPTFHTRYKAILPQVGCTCERPNDNACNYCEVLQDKAIIQKAFLSNKKYLDKMKNDGITEKFINEAGLSHCDLIDKFTALENPLYSFKAGVKWQQEQDSYWFNQYQKLEDYIISKIGEKFLDANLEHYKTASEATISLLKDNMYTEEEVYEIMQKLRLQLKSGVLKWQDDFEFDLKSWFNELKKIEN